MLKIISWNVNGIRASIKKGFEDRLAEMNPDIICLQETKAQDDQVAEALRFVPGGYEVYSNSAEKKGYSGTAILTKKSPVSVKPDIGIEDHDQEGRVLAADYGNFYLITVYTPNSGEGMKRLEYRSQWDQDFLNYINALEAEKPVIVCGDLNVAHQPIDIARPEANYNKSSGYTQVEIDGFDNLVKAGYQDTFRAQHPDEVKYSWWSFRANARARNVGWRIDYFLTSPKLIDQVTDAFILPEVEGSDHCPVGIEINL